MIPLARWGLEISPQAAGLPIRREWHTVWRLLRLYHNQLDYGQFWTSSTPYCWTSPSNSHWRPSRCSSFLGRIASHWTALFSPSKDTSIYIFYKSLYIRARLQITNASGIGSFILNQDVPIRNTLDRYSVCNSDCQQCSGALPLSFWRTCGGCPLLQYLAISRPWSATIFFNPIFHIVTILPPAFIGRQSVWL